VLLGHLACLYDLGAVPRGKSATVAGCIGVALGLLDEWLSGHDRDAPAGLAQQARPPPGTGSVNAPLGTSSYWPASDERSGHSTRRSPGKAAGMSSKAVPSL
jgi:hypothetical protein